MGVPEIECAFLRATADLGGASLIDTRLPSRIRADLGKDAPPAIVFEHPPWSAAL